MKNYMDLIKVCSNLLTFSLTNSMNFIAESQTFMRAYLVQVDVK